MSEDHLTLLVVVVVVLLFLALAALARYAQVARAEGYAALADDLDVLAQVQDKPEVWAYVVSDSPKMLRETLSRAQSAIWGGMHWGREHTDTQRLQRLIEECERHRPTGNGGKHDDRHTPTCGCVDKPEPSPCGCWLDGRRCEYHNPEACPKCRHAAHGALGFCPNMASDNHCSCTYKPEAGEG